MACLSHEAILSPLLPSRALFHFPHAVEDVRTSAACDGVERVTAGFLSRT